MRQAVDILVEQTRGRGLYEITDRVTAWLQRQDLSTGLLTLLCRHTSASLTLTENASPAVRDDTLRFLARLAPEDDSYEHAEEGPDDMPAHLRSLLTGAHLAVPFDRGRPLLGTWQGIFLVEHRTRPHRRDIAVHALGE